MTARIHDACRAGCPTSAPYLTVAEVIEHAFDYRGNVTVMRRDGGELVGYLSNRDAAAPEPFVEIIDEEGEGPIRIPYADIRQYPVHRQGPRRGQLVEGVARAQGAREGAARPVDQRVVA